MVTKPNSYDNNFKRVSKKKKDSWQVHIYQGITISTYAVSLNTFRMFTHTYSHFLGNTRAYVDSSYEFLRLKTKTSFRHFIKHITYNPYGEDDEKISPGK